VIRESAIRELNGRYRGRARDLAYLELVQEHFLHWMLVDGLFESCVFKGGTALRKFVFGLSGRFSTDLDFGSRDDGPGAYVLLMLRDGLVHEGVKFVVESDDEQDDGRHLRWRGETEEFGSTIVAKMDFTTYGSLMPAVMRARAALPGVDVRLGFEPVQVPLMDLRENAAEKLARMRRHVVARDLFDLDALAPQLRAHLPLIRQLLCFKVYFDVVDTGRGSAPFRGGVEFADLSASGLPDADDLGQLVGTTPNMSALADSVARNYSQIGEPEVGWERRLARCDRAERTWAREEAQRFSESARNRR
jgi:predicted nucleotidyltransferase component of viral defense system